MSSGGRLTLKLIPGFDFIAACILLEICAAGSLTLDIHPKYRDAMTETNNAAKPVNQYHLDGRFIQRHDNRQVAAIATSGSNDGIKACCNQDNQSSGGFIWRWSSEDPPVQVNPATNMGSSNIVWNQISGNSAVTGQTVDTFSANVGINGTLSGTTVTSGVSAGNWSNFGSPNPLNTVLFSVSDH